MIAIECEPTVYLSSDLDLTFYNMATSNQKRVPYLEAWVIHNIGRSCCQNVSIYCTQQGNKNQCGLKMAHTEIRKRNADCDWSRDLVVFTNHVFYFYVVLCGRLYEYIYNEAIIVYCSYILAYQCKERTSFFFMSRFFNM